MKKYRLIYDRVFLAEPPFEYNGYLVDGASVDLTFKFFRNGKEVLFGEDEGCSAQGQYICSVDKVRGCSLTYRPGETRYNFDSSSCEVSSWYLSVNKGRIGDQYDDFPAAYADMPNSESVRVSKEEFIKVIQEHWASFNNSDNRWAQNCAYGHEEVRD